MKKYFFWSLLVTMSVATSLRASAYDFVVGSIYYNITDAEKAEVEVTYETTSYNSYSGYVAIPSEVEYNNIAYQVTAIGNRAFYKCTSLDSVSMESSINKIDEYAFRQCTSLASIGLSMNVDTIGEYAFYYCSALTQVLLPDSLKSIGSAAFRYCSTLEEIVIPQGVSTIEQYTFCGCKAMKSIYIPSTVSKIGDSAFYQCNSLTGLTIPASLTEIEPYAFYYCSSIVSIDIPEGVTSIGGASFSGCSAMSSLTIPSTVKTIGTSAFYGCTSLPTLTIPESVDTIGESAFYKCTALTDIYSYNNLPPVCSSTNLFTLKIYSSATLHVPASAVETYKATEPWSSFTNVESISTADYTITTAAEWNALAELMATDSLDLTGKVVLIANDIDFNGDTIKPLGYNFAPMFNGELDGNGKTVSGYVAVADTLYYGALVTMTGSSAYIHDITVSGSVSSEYSYCGGAIGFLYGTASNIANGGIVTCSSNISGGVIGGCAFGSVTNCYNRGTITTSNYNTGGVIGRVWDEKVYGCGNEGTVNSTAKQIAGVVAVACEGSTLESCYNKGTVAHTGSESYPYVAGVVCMAYYGDYINCWNEGTVSEAGIKGYLAGIMAYYNGDTDGNAINLKGCYNTADISGYGRISGLVLTGILNNSPVNMTDCYNTGNLTTTGTGYVAGVILYYTPSGNYTGCYNTGTITTAGSTAGGVLGTYKSAPTSSKNVIVSKCYNTGTISAPSASYLYVGGIITHHNKYTTVDSCYNIGNVTGGRFVAGISAYLLGNATSRVSNCWNSGNITGMATSSYGGVGGIVGMNSAIDTITNCFNTGAIVSQSQIYTGGIVGNGYSEMTNVYNMGDVTGTYYVSGINGYTMAGKSVIKNAYNTGNVTPTTEGTTYFGQIVGGTDTSGLSNTFYLLSKNSTWSDVDTASVGLSYAELAKLDLGDGWTAGDNYTYPRLNTLADNDFAKAYAAAVVPADGDSYSSITTGFNVGTPDGVTWTASTDAITFDGNSATFNETINGTVTLTATCGEVSVTTEITCNVEVDGISGITGGGREVVSETFYNLAGAQVAEPSEDAKAIYIVVRSYSDGTTETVKEVR